MTPRAEAAGDERGAADVLGFWFDEAGPDKWFTKDAAFDAQIAERFGALRERAAARRLGDWEETADGALALVILLDQIPRNMFRGTAAAFADDIRARGVASRAIARGYDRALPPRRRHFLYMPFMHSEALADQECAVHLFTQLAGVSPEHARALAYARQHRDIVLRFGRFPHRNAALGRPNMPEEDAFLSQSGSSF